MSTIPGVKDANTDQQDRGLEAALVVDRDSTAHLGVSMQAVDDTLNDAFGQRPVSTIYKGLNQYRVVLEVAPEFQESPSALRDVYVRSGVGELIPLSSFAHYATRPTALAVNHRGSSLRSRCPSTWPPAPPWARRSTASRPRSRRSAFPPTCTGASREPRRPSRPPSSASRS